MKTCPICGRELTYQEFRHSYIEIKCSLYPFCSYVHYVREAPKGVSVKGQYDGMKCYKCGGQAVKVNDGDEDESPEFVCAEYPDCGRVQTQIVGGIDYAIYKCPKHPQARWNENQAGCPQCIEEADTAYNNKLNECTYYYDTLVKYRHLWFDFISLATALDKLAKLIGEDVDILTDHMDFNKLEAHYKRMVLMETEE